MDNKTFIVDAERRIPKDKNLSGFNPLSDEEPDNIIKTNNIVKCKYLLLNL